MGLLGELNPELLYVGVYGPGLGESIVIRVPGDHWIVIDGCLVNEASPAAHILAHHNAVCSCLVLTHPHEDHAKGLVDVLDIVSSGLVGCADPVVPEPDERRRSQDARRHHDLGVVEDIIQKIDDRWRSNPDHEWRVRRNDKREFGGATLTALHPDEAAVARYSGRAGKENRIATAMLLEWKEVKVLLGADVVATDWRRIARYAAKLGVHAGLKVPHHGSMGALDDGFGDGLRDRTWILTPFSPKRVPRFDDNEGMNWMLRKVDHVHMTGLPQRHDLQNVVPYRVSRQELLRDKPPAVGERLPDGRFVAFQPDSPAIHSCWVMAAFRPDGTTAAIEHGPGSLIVFDDGTSADVTASPPSAVRRPRSARRPVS